MNYQNGVMPTNEWFGKIKVHVDFKDKSVIDFGCAEGVMSKLAGKAGAEFVIGIDEQEEHISIAEEDKPINVHFSLGDLRDEISPDYDIGILSMIIHWIDKMETLRALENIDKAIIIFREKNSGYQIPANGKWFPTLKELTATLKGFKLKHSEILMEQDNHKRIILAIYEKDRD